MEIDWSISEPNLGTEEERFVSSSTVVRFRWFNMFQKDQEKISNFVVDHKFQF